MRLIQLLGLDAAAVDEGADGGGGLDWEVLVGGVGFRPEGRGLDGSARGVEGVLLLAGFLYTGPLTGLGLPVAGAGLARGLEDILEF